MNKKSFLEMEVTSISDQACVMFIYVGNSVHHPIFLMCIQDTKLYDSDLLLVW